MRTMRIWMIACLCAVGALSTAGAGSVDQGKTLFTPCTVCHGANGEGNQVLNAPKLAGQETWFIERQLLNFQKGIRGSDPKDLYGMQMKPMATTLDAAGIQDVAAYLGSLPWTGAAETISGDAEKGRAMFATCLACHGDKGQGNQTLNAPRIAGQEDWYLIRQLKNFSTGIRGTHAEDLFGAQMRPMALTVVPDPANDAALKDLAAYINTLD